MARIMDCPLCGAKVKLKVPTGSSKLICPSCKGRFAIEDGAEDPEKAPRRAARDDEDRPRRGSRRARPGDDEDRGQRKTKSGVPSGRKRMWVALAIVSVLLVGGVAATLVLLGGGGGGGSGGPGGENGKLGRIPPTLLAYLPNDAFVIGYGNVKNQLKAFGNDQSQVRLHGMFEKDYGPLENVEEVLSAQRSGDLTRGEHVFVVRFTKPIDTAKFTGRGKELQAKGKKYYELKQSKNEAGFGGRVRGDYIHFPSDSVFVRADTKGMMEEVIGADCGKFPEWYRKLIDEGEGYAVEVRRAPRVGEFINTAGAIGSLVCTSKSGNTVTTSTVEEYVSDEAALQGRKFWDELATTRRLPNEQVSVRVSGRRVLVTQNKVTPIK
jgi:hypothetical protein